MFTCYGSKKEEKLLFQFINSIFNWSSSPVFFVKFCLTMMHLIVLCMMPSMMSMTSTIPIFSHIHIRKVGR